MVSHVALIFVALLFDPIELRFMWSYYCHSNAMVITQGTTSKAHFEEQVHAMLTVTLATSVKKSVLACTQSGDLDSTSNCHMLGKRYSLQ